VAVEVIAGPGGIPNQDFKVESVDRQAEEVQDEDEEEEGEVIGF
jgi:hypothetical protein